MPPKAAAAAPADDVEEEVEDVVAPKDLDDKSLKAFFSFFKTLSDVSTSSQISSSAMHFGGKGGFQVSGLANAERTTVQVILSGTYGPQSRHIRAYGFAAQSAGSARGAMRPRPSCYCVNPPPGFPPCDAICRSPTSSASSTGR